ncbi:flagellar biosynthetic protein FliO [Granulicella sp. L60]|uniref:flagellar biosynthetic protein FliO n=1 Tax=Granulicella sp. L60 TaxID=1641866 RepID=UPI00131BC9E7|nr:flagellar biosynthetic protein FliO [Granulicella sp. L60]
MQLLHGTGRRVEIRAAGAPKVEGLAGWAIALLSGWRGEREARPKQLRLVERLSLGGKRELMLVTCGGESFLIGGGLESVESIVRLEDKGLLKDLAKSLDETCE